MTEQHIELYKKFRPQKWSQLIGQKKVAKSLQSAVAANKIPTAYLFAGERGCGKTSSAMLLAKALNCVNLSETQDPCNKCEFCVAINDGVQLGVNYISMANKGGVDDIREIVQQARLKQPLRKQVWILDEIHNISKAAFDALLIPIEEKNMPSLFILCTTAIEKVPQTILSRVQQRKFTLVESKEMANYVYKIAKHEELEVSKEQILDAVRLGRGSVRDTLSAFERIVETGESHQSYSGKVIEALAGHSIFDAISVVAEASKEGEDCRDLTEQVFEELRNYLLLKAGVDASLVGPISSSKPDEVLAGLVSERYIAALMDEFGTALTNMAFGSDSRIFLEIALVRNVKLLKKSERSAS